MWAALGAIRVGNSCERVVHTVHCHSSGLALPLRKKAETHTKMFSMQEILAFPLGHKARVPPHIRLSKPSRGWRWKISDICSPDAYASFIYLLVCTPCCKVPGTCCVWAWKRFFCCWLLRLMQSSTVRHSQHDAYVCIPWESALPLDESVIARR